MAKHHIEIDEQSHLESHEWNKQFLDCPYFDLIVIELYELLNCLLLKDFLLLSVFELIEESITKGIIVVVNSWQVYKLNLDWSFNDGVGIVRRGNSVLGQLHKLLVEFILAKPWTYLSDAYTAILQASLGQRLQLISLLQS